MPVGVESHLHNVYRLLAMLICVALVGGCLSDPADAEPPAELADVGGDSGDVDANEDCEPRECSDLDIECGRIADGCGDFVDCGTCEDSGSPQICNTDGQCVCDPGADRDHCESYEVSCGTFESEDRCGELREFDCGDCSSADSCVPDAVDDELLDEGQSQATICICEPLECGDLNAQCGTHPDGCGETIGCGDCNEDEVCTEVDERWQCDDDGSCEPDSCEDLGAKCGQIADGCGGTKECGSCETANYNCEDNQCVCDIDDETAEARCAEEGLEECGVTAVDGCVIECGECSAGCECEDGMCRPTGFGIICAISGFGD